MTATTTTAPTTTTTTAPTTTMTAPAGAASSLEAELAELTERGEGANPAVVSRLEDRICTLAAHLAAAMCRFLVLLGEYDNRGGWAGIGIRSCAHWLSWRCGISPNAAREQVRVARALRELPATTAEFAAGRISYSKVRALTRVATAGTEAELLSIAGSCPAGHLERIVRGYRQVQRITAAGEIRPGDRDPRATQLDRNVSWHWAEDGSLLLQARLAPDEGAVVLAALNAARDALRTPSRAKTTTAPGVPAETPAPSNADALAAMAETMLAGGARPAPGGERYQLVLHVDSDALTDSDGNTDGHRTAAAGTTAPAPLTGRCHLDDGPRVHPHTARRIACDAAAISILHAGRRPGQATGDVLDVGRRTRIVNPALRRALRERDHGCAFPGCTQTRWVDAHHLWHWADGGPTTLWNLISLCRFHHTLVHERGYSIARTGDGRFLFLHPTGTPLPAVPTAPPINGTIDQQHPAQVNARSLHPTWGGEPLDLHHTIWAILNNQRNSAGAQLRDGDA